MADVEMLAPIQEGLANKELLPQQHLVGTGYTRAESLAVSQSKYQVDVVDPVSLAPSWQRHSGEGYEVNEFDIDWHAQYVTCLGGRSSINWNKAHDGAGNEVIYVRFNWAECKRCELRQHCIQAKNRGRSLTLRLQPYYEALQRARLRQTGEEFKQQYALRAGVEGSLSQGVRAFGLRKSRYIGLAKPHLQHEALAVALNLVRGLAWLEGKKLVYAGRATYHRLVVRGPKGHLGQDLHLQLGRRGASLNTKRG
jgi:transposase